MAHSDASRQTRREIELPVIFRIDKPVHWVEIAISARLGFNTDQGPIIVFGYVPDAHFQRYLVSVPVGVIHDDFPVRDNIRHDSHMTQGHPAGCPKRHHSTDSWFIAAFKCTARPSPPILGVAANLDAAEVTCVGHAPHPLPPGLLLRDLPQSH